MNVNTMRDNRMKFVKSENGLDYYIFTPTLFRQYFNKSEEWTPHRKSIAHKIHMFLYYMRGGYKILYMLDGDNIVAYLVYARCGKTVVENTTREDIFTVFVTTHPNYRHNGYATKIVYELLHGINLKYSKSFKTISDSNIGSLKSALKNGYQVIFPIKKSKTFKTIIRTDYSKTKLYVVENNMN